MARALVCFVLLAVLAACGGEETAPAGPPAALADLSGTALTGTVGAELPDPLRVRVTDAAGQGVPGVAVNFTAGAGSGQVTAIPTTTSTSAAQLSVAAAVLDSTDANGEARARWTLGTVAGEQTVSVTVAGIETLVIRARADAGAPTAMEFLSSSAFIGVAGQQADGPITVRVRDQYNNPVRGVSVTWAALAGGGGVATAAGQTDSAGRAETTVMLGATHGLHLFSASAAGLGPDTVGVVAVFGVTDPSGDGLPTGDPAFPSHDVTVFGGTVVGNTLVLYYRFSGQVSPMVVSGNDPNNALLAFLEFDADQDSTTGYLAIRRCAEIDSLGFGVDAFLDLDPTSALLGSLPSPPDGAVPAARVDSLDSSDRCGAGFFGGLAAVVPVYRGNTVSVGVPLGLFVNGPVFDFTSLILNAAAPALTDIVPDSLPQAFDLSGAVAAQAIRSGATARAYLPTALASAPVQAGRFVRARLPGR